MAATKTAAPSKVVRLVFDKERKLKVRSRYVRQALQEANKSLSELITDPMAGYPYLVKALLGPNWVQSIEKRALTVDVASDLIDDYVDNNGSMDGLTQAIVEAFQGYLRIEAVPADDEDDEPGNSTTLSGPGSSDSDD